MRCSCFSHLSACSHSSSMHGTQETAIRRFNHRFSSYPMLAQAAPIKQIISLVHAGCCLLFGDVSLNKIQKAMKLNSKIVINTKLLLIHETKSLSGWGTIFNIEPMMQKTANMKMQNKPLFNSHLDKSIHFISLMLTKFPRKTCLP